MSGVESIPSSRGTRADVIFHHNRPLVPAQPLASVFRDVTDPRDRRGVRHDPPTILCLGCDGDPATYITRSSRTTRRSPLAIRARTAVRLMDVAAAILGGRNVRRPHRIPPPSMTNASPPPDPEGYSGVVRVVLVGLLGRPGAGTCPHLPQRRPGPGSAANETAEYQRFSSGVPARSGPLWQIWTTGAAAGPVGRASPASAVHDVGTGADTRAEGGRRPGGRPVRPRRPRPSASAGPAQAPRSPGAPHHRPLNSLPARSGSLWRIWTIRRRGPAGEGVRGRAGPAPGQRRDAARGVPEDFRPCAWAASESSGTRPGSAPRSTTRLRSSTKTTRGT